MDGTVPPVGVSGYTSNVIESPPGVFDALARASPRAAWQAADAVRSAAELHLDSVVHSVPSIGLPLGPSAQIGPQPTAVALELWHVAQYS